MSRFRGFSKAYATVSVVALTGLLAGCSQPASYATVDLSGSYGNAGSQAFSAGTGQPVYQSTQTYSAPAFNQNVLPQSQLVYRDAPTNQFAALNPTPSFSAPFQQQSFPVLNDAGNSGPFLTQDTILRSDSYIDTGNYDGIDTAALAPGAGSIGNYQSAPVYSDAAPIQSFTLPAPAPAAPVILETTPLAAPTFPTIPQNSDIYTSIPDTYEQTTLAPQTYTQTYQEPVEASPPAPSDTQAVIDYFDLERDSRQAAQQPQPVAFPTPDLNPVALPAPAPTAVPTVPAGDIALPAASVAYPRPYEALRPGFFPTYEFDSVGDLISSAEPQTAPSYVADAAPQGTISQSILPAAVAFSDATPSSWIPETAQFGSSYTIKAGDTLYSIARKHNVSPKALAKANDISLSGIIYPGSVLTVPDGVLSGGPETLGDAPVVVLQTAEAAPVDSTVRDISEQTVPLIDIEELARVFRDNETGNGTGSLPVITAEAGDALRGRPNTTPTEIIRDPVQPVPAIGNTIRLTPAIRTIGAYAWPLHGNVYRLSDGQIDIEAPLGSTVTAAAAGRVAHVENGPRGVLVVIEHADGWRSLTLGLKDVSVFPGQMVSTGDILGKAGQARVRFELRDSNANIAEALNVLKS